MYAVVKSDKYPDIADMGEVVELYEYDGGLYCVGDDEWIDEDDLFIIEDEKVIELLSDKYSPK